MSHKINLSIISTLFLVVSILVTLSLSSVAFAQDAGPSDFDWEEIRNEIDTIGESVSGLEIPYLEARSIELDKKTYRPGEIVNGTLVVRNGGTIGADNIIPTISLVGDYKGLIHSKIYDVDNTQEQFSLAPGEQKTIFFEYKLPNTFQSNDLGIQAEYFTDTGLRQDLVSKKFTYNGEIFAVDLERVAINLRGNEYDLRVTPAVYAGDEFSLDVILSSENEIKVIPNIDVYAFSAISGDKVESVPYNNLTLDTDSKEVTLKMNSSLPGGLYEGVATFKDTEGNDLAAPVMFLYMVVGDGGAMFEIKNITAVPDPINDNEQIFTVSYTGGAADIDILLFDQAPSDISSDENIEDDDEIEEDNVSGLPDTPDYSGVSVVITVKDSNGLVVGEGDMNATNAEDFVLRLPVDVSGVIPGKYEVTAKAVNSNGITMDTYTKVMTLDTNQEPVTAPTGNLMFLIALILIIVVIIFIPKKRKVSINNNI